MLTNIINPLFFFSAIVLAQDSRIINGFPVEPEFKYPWMATIFRYGEYFCGATLIRDDMIITAAHCAGGLIAPLDTFEVQLHRHNLAKSIEEENGKAYKVLKRWVPTDFDRDALYNDIAIMQFDNKSKRRNNVRIDDQLYHREGMRVTALGWGATKPLGANTDELQEVWLPLASRNNCVGVYKQKLNYTVVKTQICAGFKQGGKDTCRGDSGGPLFSYVNDKPLLIGITSNGIACAEPNTPAVYTRVARYYGWIQKVMNGKLKPNPIPARR
ncbi:trypsin-like serine protease [Neoconidiobolus thromboides FSU 785]|nr:trypsin-like serine protease [Neoconidiobolus thromboides FSU 785]